MAYLYIGNCTMQNHVVKYRLDFDKNGQFDPEDKYRDARAEAIPPGNQIAIGGDLHQAQVTSIIDQLKPYGLTKFDEISRTKAFVVPYIYREGLVIPGEAIRRQRDINNGVHQSQGKVRRQAAAVAVNQAVLEAAQLTAPKLTSVEFEQTTQSEHGESRIEEGINVTAAPTKGKPGPKPGQKKAA